MPEPTTRQRGTASPEYLVHVFLQRWDRGETLVENAGDALRYGTLAELLADFDALAARAAAAEAAVQRVRDLHSPVVIEVLEWQCHTGRCTHVEDCVEIKVTVCKTCDDIRTDANEESAVVAWPCPTVTALDVDAPPQPDLTTVSGFVNAAPDDQPVTVTGYIHYVRACANQGGASYLEMVLVDRDAEFEDSDPASVKVEVPAAVYAAMDLAMRPREGTLVEVTGRAVREVLVIASGVREAGYVLRNGEPVYDRSDEQAPPWLDWTEQDEAARTEGGAL